MTSPQTNLGSAVQYRVTFCGPFGVGKTTAVRTLCGDSMLTTEAERAIVPAGHTGMLDTSKNETTVGFDYGEWSTAAGKLVRVFGTPGQSRFDQMRSMMCRADTAVVLWLDGSASGLASDCVAWLDVLGEQDLPSPPVVAITRVSEDEQEGVVQQVRSAVPDGHEIADVILADPRVESDVQRVAEYAVQQVLSRGRS